MATHRTELVIWTNGKETFSWFGIDMGIDNFAYKDYVVTGFNFGFQSTFEICTCISQQD